MRPIKVFLSTAYLISCFTYGVGVGVYKWFPYKPLQTLKDKLIDVPTSESNNEELLVELAKTNNIDPSQKQSESNLYPSLGKQNSTTFISYGDIQPYIEEDSIKKFMRGFLRAINFQNASLIVHVGDTQNGFFQCTDSLSDLQRKLMNSLKAPVLYTPGDNEWRDCTDKTKGESHNLERLAYIRKTYFSNNRTLGRKSSIVENQSMLGFPENARLINDNVAFITAHVVGENNNFDPMSKQNTLEYLERDAANIAWIKESFKRYKDASAYVVVTHANIFDKKITPDLNYRKFAYRRFANTLSELSNKYNKPVLSLHGNMHKFKAFQPMKDKYPHLHVIQNFGYPDLKAIKIEVDISKKKPFNVIKIID